MRLLVLGTGNMARSHAEAFAAIPGVQIVAAVDALPANLAGFCESFGVARGYLSLDEALDAGGFDAATNVTPDAVHHPTSLALMAAGIHVLCEKPLATDHRAAAEMAAAAAARGVVNVVNLTYRNGPALQKAAGLVAAGALGTLRHLEASYLQSWLTQPAWGDWRTESRWLWRLSTVHGSKGVLGDVGIHILDFASFAAGEPLADLSCRLKVFPKAPGERIGEYLLDANDGFVLHLGLAGGAVGTVSATRMASGHHNDLRLRLYGDRGGLEVSFEQKHSRLRACLGADLLTETWREIEAPPVSSNYERFIAAIRGEAGPAAPDFARGAELQLWLDLAETSDREQGRILPV